MEWPRLVSDHRFTSWGNLPHDWLFPRCAAVVHHCGAGTTHASAKAGVPTVGVPTAADQPYYADLLFRRGVGTSPLPMRQLTGPALLARVEAALRPDMREQAARLGSLIQAERGVARAVSSISRLSRATENLFTEGAFRES